MQLDTSVAVFVFVSIVTFVLTKVVLLVLKKRSVFDFPNERSSHFVPTPRGGGIAVLIVLLPGLLALAVLDLTSMHESGGLCFFLLLLGVMCWVDDLYSLTPVFRLVFHGFIVGIAISLSLFDALIFGGFFPPLVDKIVSGILWIWFINLFNFMDGIDGIAATETISICIGIILLVSFADLNRDIGYVALLLAGTAFGFLFWNWYPAKIFLGDVGSVPIGFLLGWLLLSLVSKGYWVAALIFPAYFVIDATVTLIRRLFRGQRIWEAHREHFYQYAVQGGKSHSKVSGRVGLTNIILIFLAVFLGPENQYIALLGSFGVVILLIFWMIKTGNLRSKCRPKE